MTFFFRSSGKPCVAPVMNILLVLPGCSKASRREQLEVKGWNGKNEVEEVTERVGWENRREIEGLIAFEEVKEGKVARKIRVRLFCSPLLNDEIE